MLIMTANELKNCMSAPPTGCQRWVSLPMELRFRPLVARVGDWRGVRSKFVFPLQSLFRWRVSPSRPCHVSSSRHIERSGTVFPVYDSPISRLIGCTEVAFRVGQYLDLLVALLVSEHCFALPRQSPFVSKQSPIK
jgi:hypothetical protein